MEKIFHISEEKGIEKFIPRKSKKIWNYENYVWAIGEKKVQNYYLPRGCPRICVNQRELTLHKISLENFDDEFENVILVPEIWRKRIEEVKLYQYEFAKDNFKLIDKIAGYYVSKEEEIPKRVLKIENCFNELKKIKTKVLFKKQSDLEKIKIEVLEKINDFSIIRF